MHLRIRVSFPVGRSLWVLYRAHPTHPGLMQTSATDSVHSALKGQRTPTPQPLRSGTGRADLLNGFQCNALDFHPNLPLL